jgi:hypothetical protein
MYKRNLKLELISKFCVKIVLQIVKSSSNSPELIQSVLDEPKVMTYTLRK